MNRYINLVTLNVAFVSADAIAFFSQPSHNGLLEFVPFFIAPMVSTILAMYGISKEADTVDVAATTDTTTPAVSA